MCWFLKKNKDTSADEDKVYYDNIKDASFFLDKAILTLSSVFLGFLFSQIENLLNIEVVNIGYLIISIFSIGITIFFVLSSYVLTIYQAQLGINSKGSFLFDFIDSLINISRILYFFTFITPVFLTILFYISNLTK